MVYNGVKKSHGDAFDELLDGGDFKIEMKMSFSFRTYIERGFRSLH